MGRGSARVSDAALREAAWIIRHVLSGRDGLLHALAENRGMDVVRKIHESPAEGQTLTPPILIRRATRTH